MTLKPIKERLEPMAPATTQILFVDIQPKIVGSSRTNPPDGIIRSAVAIARIGKLFDLPMTVSLVPVGDAAPRLVPEPAAVLGDGGHLVRTMVPVFDDAATAAVVKAHDRHDLVICGVVTEVAVLLACFGARADGHEVHVPVDAYGGLSQRTEQAAFRRIESLDANTGLPPLK